MKKISVKQDLEKPVPVEVIAESIKNISSGIRNLRSGPLNEKALVLLIQHAAPRYANGQTVSQTDIRSVFDGIESLERTYLKKAVR